MDEAFGETLPRNQRETSETKTIGGQQLPRDIGVTPTVLHALFEKRKTAEKNEPSVKGLSPYAEKYNIGRT